MKPGKKTSEFWVMTAIVFVVLLLAGLFFWFGKIAADQWIAITKWIPGLLGSSYIFSRTLTKALDKGGSE